MALASSRANFFKAYKFDFDETAPLDAEFHRLARLRKWRQGSQSRAFEKAWARCFCPLLTARLNTQDCLEPPDVHDDFVCVWNDHQERMSHRERRAHRACLEFTEMYGNDVNDKGKWQKLCEDCELETIPSSIPECKMALRDIYVNIFDFLAAKRNGQPLFKFISQDHLAAYLQNHPRKRYSLHMAKSNKFMSALLIDCW